MIKKVSLWKLIFEWETKSKVKSESDLLQQKSCLYLLFCTVLHSQQDPRDHILLGIPESAKLAEDRKHRLRVSAIIISGWENLEHPRSEGGMGRKWDLGSGRRTVVQGSGIRLRGQVIGLNTGSSIYQLCDLEQFIFGSFTISSLRLG